MMIKKFNNSYFVKNLNLLKKNLDNVFLIFIFDVWFIAILFVSARLANLIGRNLFTQPLESYSSAPLVTFIIIYYILIVLVYSFFKYIVLHYLKKMFIDIKLNFRRFLAFFVQNLIIALSYFVIFFVLNGIFLLNVKTQVAPFVFVLILLLFLFFAYAFLNIVHTLFINYTNSKEILKNAFGITFNSIKSYVGIYLSNIIILGIYFAVFSLVGSLLKRSPSSSTIYPGYFNTFTILTVLIIYLLVFFNRSYFYLIIKERQKF